MVWGLRSGGWGRVYAMATVVFARGGGELVSDRLTQDQAVVFARGGTATPYAADLRTGAPHPCFHLDR